MLQIFALKLDEPPTARQLATLRLAAWGDVPGGVLSLAGRALARVAVSRATGVPAREICFERDAHGKPYLAGGGVFFNVSHSGDVCVCAVCDREIGVDVERIREDFSQRVAERFFDADEQRRLSDCADAEKARTFFTIWTQKESRVKLTGEGIAALRKPPDREIHTESFALFDRYVVSVSVFDM